MPIYQSEYGQQRWVEYLNNTGLIVPAFGVIKVSGALLDGALTVIQSNGQEVWLHAFNGNGTVADGQRGELTFDLPANVLYDSSIDTPAYKDEWVPQATSFKLKKLVPKRGSKFFVFGIIDAANEIMVVGPC